MCTQTKETFFTVFLFKENEAKRETFWDNVISTTVSLDKS
jgi:hypothetical protein